MKNGERKLGINWQNHLGGLEDHLDKDDDTISRYQWDCSATKQGQPVAIRRISIAMLGAYSLLRT